MRSSHQTVSGASKKIVLPSIFLWCETCRVMRLQFWIKECDILKGSNILWPVLHIFLGVKSQDPHNPRTTPLDAAKMRVLHMTKGVARRDWIRDDVTELNLRLSQRYIATCGDGTTEVVRRCWKDNSRPPASQAGELESDNTARLDCGREQETSWLQ